MTQVTQAFPHLDLKTVKQKVKLASSYWERQKWQVIYNALAEPRTAAEIALHVGVSKGFVRKVIQQYNRQVEQINQSKSLKVPENIRLIFQPAHSPELMPVEHIWEEIREKHFYNQVFTTLNQVEDVLCQGLVELCSERDRLRSLTFFPHLRILPLNAT
jgi:hypothetical protein